jgi:hypothetical protein
MIEEDFPCCGQLNATRLSFQQLHTELKFEIANLTAEGGL